MRMSLLPKLLIFITALLVTAVLILFYSAHRTGHELLEEVGNAKALAVIEIGKANVEHMMLVKKENRIEHALRNIEHTGAAISVAVLDADGRVFVSPSESDRMVHIALTDFKALSRHPSVKTRRFERNDSTFQDVITAFENKPECYGCHDPRETTIGYLMATIPLQDLQTISSIHRTGNILLILATFAGLAISIFIVMYFLVARPTRKLNSSMKSVLVGAHGLRNGVLLEIEHSPINYKQDEIGELARLFTQLVKQLNAAYEQLLQRHHGELVRADQLSTTGEMAASIAHEIKNPVAGLSAALQIFRRDLPLEDPRREIVIEMLEQVGRINNAVNDLLSYARPGQPQFIRLDLVRVIRRTIALLQPVASEHHITIEELNLEDPIEITADGKLIQQLLWNITINAIQAMPLGGTVSIGCRVEENDVQLEVRDTGKGIPDEELHLIFKPFYTTKHKGTGLGMSISKRIVEQHGGNMRIESTLEEGTSVWIHLPLGVKIHES
ncbi:MAG: hypothetical protein IH600_09510 [Bacteroidetes bacterium]|nr:hypothetical protein [Bacteroidota bacterium]